MDALRWNKWGSLLGLVVLTVLSNMVILWGVSRLLVFAAGFVLTCLLPGYLLIRVALPGDNELDWVEDIALMIGVGFAALILGTLGLHYLSGPLTSSLILALYDGLILLLVIVLFLRRGAGVSSTGRSPVCYQHLGATLVLVLLAAFFRFDNLGYSEFQGDEARAMLMAAGVIRGEDEILFLHKKGPAEVLVPAASYALYGTIDEFAARLPFALASLAGILSVYILTRRMFPRRVSAALIAAGLLAIDGYLVAFGRIVQYQSVVFLMMTLAAWCFYVWYRDHSPMLAILAALFVAVGTLAHYEAVLVVPFMAWLFWARGRRESWPLRQWIQHALAPGITFAIVFSLFYVPFVLHPHFASTAEYITEGRIGGDLFYNNLGDFFFRATFYNSTYYIIFLILGLLALVIHQLYAALRPAPLAVAVLLALAAGVVIAALFPQALVIRGLSLAFLPFAATLILLIASPRVTTELEATFLWFGVPFLIALFLMHKPKTHVYLMFPAWTVLIGVTLGRVVATLDRRIVQSLRKKRIGEISLSLVGIALLIVFGYYTYIVFVRHTPDYRRGYPATRPPFYPVIYGDQLPQKGLFGFPHRGGWKAIGVFYAQGVLQGSYSANEETLITSWYTRRAAWCRDAADYYFITNVVQDVEMIPVDRIRDENYLLGRVWSDGRPTLEIYSRQPVDVPVEYDLAELERLFDATTQPDVWLWALQDPVPQYRVDARLGESVYLIGFDAPRRVAAGGVLPLVLYWEPLVSFDRHYDVFAHVEVEGEHIWGQGDSTLACGRQPTTEWQPGQLVVDGHSLRVDPAAPPGEYPLLVGLYDSTTGERLPVIGRDSNPCGNAVRLGTVEIIAPVAAESTQ